MNILQSKFVRRLVGVTGLVSAILWILLSLGMIIVSFTAVDKVITDITTQQNETQKKFEAIQDPIFLGVPLPTPQIWDDAIGKLKDQTTAAFDGILIILNFIKISTVIIPFMIVLSQVMPAILGLQLLFD